MITTIRSIIDRYRGRVARTEHPYEMTDSELSALRALAGDEHFAVFVEVLDRRIKLDAELLLHPTAPGESVHFCRGKLAGLRQAGTLVDEILTTESHLAASRSRRDTITGPERPTAAARFSSPFAERS